MYSILIIEDDDLLCKTMESILESEGFNVRAVGCGVAGIAGAREKRPDLILCDVVMPEMDGHAVLATLKNDPLLADIPFIFVTAQDGRAALRRAMCAGADDYLTKPFFPEELLDAVTVRLQRAKAIQSNAEQSVFREEYTFLQHRITARELEVLVLVGQGYTSKEIAELLGIRGNTVQVHRTNLMDKLDAPNAATLARWAVIAERMHSAD